MLRAILVEKLKKKHKNPGWDLKEIFLPNKKPYSMVCGSNSNFLSRGYGDFLKYPF